MLAWTARLGGLVRTVAAEPWHSPTQPARELPGESVGTVVAAVPGMRSLPLLALFVSSCCISHAPDVADVCPAAVPSEGDPCSADGLLCEYGTDTCCGQRHPSYVCECVRGSQFTCYHTDCSGSCPCTTDADCAWGAEWCEAGVCVPCDNSGLTCLVLCVDSLVPPRNGCQPCECAPEACTMVGSGSCDGCGQICPAGQVCDLGLSRCVDDWCARVDCAGPCDPLRGCVEPECTTDADCRLIPSSCSCQAVAATSPETFLDECRYDGGALCRLNSCSRGVVAACINGLCTESQACPATDCRTTDCAAGSYCGECLTPVGSAWSCLPDGSAC